MKHSWKLINILLGKNKKSNNISQLKCDDVVISDDTLKAEAFNDFFVNIGVIWLMKLRTILYVRTFQMMKITTLTITLI